MSGQGLGSYREAVSVEVRTVTEDEVEAFTTAFRLGLHVGRPADGEAAARRRRMDLDRTQAAFDGDDVVGTFRSFGSDVALPGGGRATASAVTQVAVAPTHRRRGLLREMMGRDLRAAQERCEVLAILIAAEYPIYGRYGFGDATEHVTATIDADTARFVGDADVSLALVGDERLRAIGPGVFEARRSRQPGEIERPDWWWDLSLGIVASPGFEPTANRHVVAHDAAGEPVGYVSYHVEEVWEQRLPRHRLVVDDLVGATPAVEARLWRYCCEVDLVRTVHAADRSVADPLVWFLDDARAVRQSDRSEFLWVRVLDPVGAWSGRVLRVEGDAVVDVVDPDGPAAGRYLLEGGPDGCRCARTTRSADVRLSVADLGRLLLGGASPVALAAAGRLDEQRPGAALRLDALVGWPVAPFCSTWF